MSSTIHKLPAGSFWMPSYPPRPSAPLMSRTFDGTSSVACQTPPSSLLPCSAVNSSFLANGSYVDPSKVGRALPFTSVLASKVTRCAWLASRLIRVR